MTFGKVERGGVFYIPLSSLKIINSVYASQHCVAFVLGATQTTTKISLVTKNSCTRHNTEGVVHTNNRCGSGLKQYTY